MTPFAKPLAAVFERRTQPAFAGGPQRGTGALISALTTIEFVPCAIIATTVHEFMAVDVMGKVFIEPHALFAISDYHVMDACWRAEMGS